MTLRWSDQEFEDWRLRKGAHAPSAAKQAEQRQRANLIPGGHTEAAIKAKPRGMNKWEATFAQTLEARRQAGELVWWAYEPFRIRLADDTFYRPDFATVDNQGKTEIYEVKGLMREAARVRLRVATEKLPYQFYIVRKHKGELRITKV